MVTGPSAGSGRSAVWMMCDNAGESRMRISGRFRVLAAHHSRELIRRSVN
jgi:hypothetical protein